MSCERQTSPLQFNTLNMWWLSGRCWYSLHSTAWSEVNEVGGNFETHFNRCKNKAFRSQTNNQILQITSIQELWWVYYLLLSECTPKLSKPRLLILAMSFLTYSFYLAVSKKKWKKKKKKTKHMRKAFLSFAFRMINNTFSNTLWFQVLILGHLEWITLSKRKQERC